MATAKNDITGEKIQTRPANDLYRENWDKIFGKKKVSPCQAHSMQDSPSSCTGESTLSDTSLIE